MGRGLGCGSGGGICRHCADVSALRRRSGRRSPYACGGETIARGSASRIVDGRTFVLDDGREVRLAAIEVPASRPRRNLCVVPGAAAARDALATQLAGAEVVLKQAEPQKTDRYGRVVAYAFAARDGVERSAQADLIAAGFARVAAAGRQPGLRRGTPRPGKCRAAGQAWPLGQFVL